MNKNKVIAVVGPTASGKTRLAIDIAKKYDGEIISCDSMQIYKGMPIGTAQPTEEELSEVKHHLVSFLTPSEEFSVSEYVEMAEKSIEDVLSRGKTPVIAGGTGLYVRSLLYGIEFTDNSRDDNLRNELEKRAENGEISIMYDELKRLDPKAAEGIHINNTKRVIRALEYCLITGEKFSEQSVLGDEPKPKYDFEMIGINYRDRDVLYDRINKRVDIMLESGLLEEAKSFFERENNATSAQAIGYKELFPYFEGIISLEEAADNIKKSTRHYAKRQLTWFRKERKIEWVYPDDYDNYKDFFESVIKITERN